MRVLDKPFDQLIVLEPRVFNDNRGLFFESFNQGIINELIGQQISFFQDNHSVSKKNVIRGLHLQAPPFEQGKLVRVSYGSVYDVAVDVRIGSPTYGKFFGLELSSKNNLMLWIPPGFAHGFSVLEDDTVFLYKCTNVYHKESEQTLLFNDITIGIDWKVQNPVISDKDKVGTSLKEFKSPFQYNK
jgi:dTDP-4-dehydrorhamnose 3,5-epimerase